MTLVLPYCSNQVKNLSFEPLSSKMPCVFDAEPLDFESALMGNDWPALKDIAADYGAPNVDTTSAKATPGPSEKAGAKRKLSTSNGDSASEESGPPEPKRPCTDGSAACSFTEEPVSPIALECPSSPVSSEGLDEPANITDEDEELYMPRRRVLQMWNSRQRWKDERKRVLKMSVNKLSDIEDPELWLLRSVVINNTIKRLHQDIRNERQAKIRHRQQKIDFYNDKYEPLLPADAHDPSSSSSYSTTSSYDVPGRPDDSKTCVEQQPSSTSTTPSETYDDTSCDEIFGISEDFLRVTIPDRRVSSPIPTNPVQDSENKDSSSLMEVDPSFSTSPPSSSSSQATSSLSCYSSKATLVCDTDRSRSTEAASEGDFARPRTQTSGLNVASQQQQRHHSGGSQCATQYRTNVADGDNVGGDGEGVFPPRVPILDSVVYHSLLASLESS